MKVRDFMTLGLLGKEYTKRDFSLVSSWNGATIYRSWHHRKLNDAMLDMEVHVMQGGLHQNKNGWSYSCHVELWVNAYDYQHKKTKK